MAKRTEQQITKVSGVDPNWLMKYAEQDASLAGMDEYRILPRMKVIQAMTDTELKIKFGEGSIIVRPGDSLLWSSGMVPFKFVPLFFCVEFAKWADMRDKQSSMIVARSYDPTSDIAKFSRDSDDRSMEYDGQEKTKEKDKMYYRFVEHLRFFGIIYGEHELSGQHVALSFERGEFSQGRNFISAIKMRKFRVGDKSYPVPLWSQVWDMKSGFRDKGDKKWYGIDFVASEVSMIDPVFGEEFLTYHKEFKELFEKQRLRVDDQEAEGEGLKDSTEY